MHLVKASAVAVVLSLSIFAPRPAPARASSPAQTLADWKTWPVAGLETQHAQAERGPDGWLTVRTQAHRNRAGILLRPRQGTWNLEAFDEVTVPVRNLSDEAVNVVLRVDDDRSAAMVNVGQIGGARIMRIAANATVWLTLRLGAGRPQPFADKFVSMRGNPPEFSRPTGVNGSRIVDVRIFLLESQPERTLAVGPIVARGKSPRLDGLTYEQVFPFIDEFGQYIHRDWPGKIQAEEDFSQRRDQEEADLAGHKRPADWNRFGGWTAGPKHKATGFFRVEKIDGRWWMVDPEGCLFWSHGSVRVGTRIRVGTVYRGTPLLDREFYFRLPPKDSPLAAFFGTEPQATHSYYLGKEGHAIYDHLEANLFRKYGADWVDRYAEVCQRRLASWGLNTIANSSDPAIYRLRRTPYTAIVYSAPLGRCEHRIEGSTGGWGKLPDPFDPGFREIIRRTLSTDLKDSLADPWCLGFFVDNELNWGDTCYLGQCTLASPAGQPAKDALIAQLRERYGQIEKLNQAWSTRHASWQAFSASTEVPDRKRPAVREDLEAGSRLVVDAYFRVCRDTIRQAAPNHMYLGCRFAGGSNPLVMQAAARYCDVISINRYTDTVDDLRLPDGLDRPIVIGEFHFGAMDRGLFHPGHRPVPTQADRATAYCNYVESALRNPAIIGTHWFQFYDQPTTGRFDGENYQTGLLDICDTPYWETVKACRQMGAKMYAIRARGE